MDDQATPQIDRLKLNRLLEEMKSNQNLSMGIVSGFVAAIIGAVAWGTITHITGYQIGFMAVGVGFIVGYSVRRFGKGIDVSFGVIGALLSLLGCLMGNMFTACIFISREMGMGLFTVIGRLNLEIISGILTHTFNPMDLLFYGIAIYEGYKFSFRRLEQRDISSLQAN